MSGFLLDTNLISETVKPRPEPAVLRWLDGVDERALYLSVLTLGEIRKGVAALDPRSPQGKKRTQLEAWLELELPARFAGRILAVDAAVADRWGQLAARAKAEGATLPVIDGLIAATALQHNLTVVSRNATDFAGTQVAVWNPWAG
jgi:toxin FitB